jgi:predicted negative regulator of RcsB-dependent stress response
MIIDHSTLIIRTESALATATRITGKSTATTPTTSPASATPGIKRPELSERLNAWFGAHKQLTSWVGAIVVVGALLFVWQISAKSRTEAAASRALQGARFAYENQNLPLAASELAKVMADYEGTNAAQQARLLLGNVRLLQGQPQQAVSVLQDYAGGAGKAYRAQAYSLLGAAYENMGRFREAGEAYETGSTAGRLDFLKAQLLADAGRAWTTAGDTAKAVAAYRRIVKDFPKEAAANEARVRLAELTKGTVS